MKLWTHYYGDYGEIYFKKEIIIKVLKHNFNINRNRRCKNKNILIYLKRLTQIIINKLCLQVFGFNIKQKGKITLIKYLIM